MGMAPDYDLNNPMRPKDPEYAEYLKELEESERMEQLNKMWRNPIISDTYDPGSTFKLITVSAALEQRVTSPDEGGFRCAGHYQIGKSSSIRCWRYYNPHGLQTVTQAVGNSCNPVMVQLAQRMGYDNFYKYIEKFGFTGLTGIDFPGEGLALIQSRQQAGALGLANMAFGQGISVTPIQLVTAVSGLGNGGSMMQPRLVKGVADENGEISELFKPKVIRQVVSEQTAAEIRGIMETTINVNIKAAKIPGYRIGGKSGTAEKLVDGSYKTGKVVSSMLLMAPMDDPQICLVIIVDEPDSSLGEVFGSTVAAPGAKSLMSDVLTYLNIAPCYSDEELAAMEKDYVLTPNVTGMNINDAVDMILGENLTYKVSPANRYYDDFDVLDQYPRAGERLLKGRQVILYRE
jgi:stage V sporulation protein D (sporulation-specific penicillin-binding protein)